MSPLSSLPTSVVYFIRSGTLIKIGSTGNLPKRFGVISSQRRGVQTELIGTIAGGRRVEKSLQNEFAAFHKGGDWFEEDPIMMRVIEKLLWKRGTFGDDALLSFDGGDASWEKTKGSEKHFVEAAAAKIDVLMTAALPHVEFSVKRAAVLVARKVGIGDGIMWTLRYRLPRSLTAGAYHAIMAADPATLFAPCTNYDAELVQ